MWATEMPIGYSGGLPQLELPEQEVPLPKGFGHRRPLAQAAQDKDSKLRGTPGLYVIYKRMGKTWKPTYLGQSQNLRERLQKHLWSVTHLGGARWPYQVRVSVMPGSTESSRKSAEKAILRKYPDVFTNVQRELAEFLWGESWS